MKQITKKSFTQKIIISILTVLLVLNFAIPTYSNASPASQVGGILLDPITDLLCTIGDIVINILQLCLDSNNANQLESWSLSAFMVDSTEEVLPDKIKPSSEEESINTTVNVSKTDEGFVYGWLWNSDNYGIPVTTISPEEIFAGNIDFLSINFFDEQQGSRVDLQEAVARWYVALRNLTLVGLLSVLVYVAIRMIISSTAKDKAKYKKMLVDWVVALCLVFFMHYIMVFTVTITESITKALANNSTNIVVTTSGDATGTEKTFKTNLLGLARFRVQSADPGTKISFLIMYLAMVIYTGIFAFFYLKRMITIVFLTLISPIVALTYPIDKMKDGKSQAFDNWLKEYMFNVLIQPLHLIIYTVLIGTAMELASSNILYVIVAMASIIPSEKLLRKFFGLGSGSSTLGALANVAAATSLLSKGGSSKGGAKSNSNSEKTGAKPIRYNKDKPDISNINAPNGALAQGKGATDGYSATLDNSADDSGYNLDGDSNNTNPQSNNENRYSAAFENSDNADGYSATLDNSADYSGYNLDANSNNTEGYSATLDNSADDSGYNLNGNSNNVDANDDIQKVLDNYNDPDLQENSVNYALSQTKGKKFIKGAGRLIGKYTPVAGKAALNGTGKLAKVGMGALAGAVTIAAGGSAAEVLSVAKITGKATGNMIDSSIDNFKNIKNGQEPKVIKNVRDAFADIADTYNGDTERADARKVNMARKQFAKNEENKQYVKDMLTKQKGKTPTKKEIDQTLTELNPYVDQGLNIKEALGAKNAADKYGISHEQSALIAAVGKDREITKEKLNDDKKCTAEMKNLKQSFIDKGLDAKEAEKNAKYTIQVLKAQNGVEHNLKK